MGVVTAAAVLRFKLVCNPYTIAFIVTVFSIPRCVLPEELNPGNVTVSKDSSNKLNITDYSSDLYTETGTVAATAEVYIDTATNRKRDNLIINNVPESIANETDFKSFSFMTERKHSPFVSLPLGSTDLTGNNTNKSYNDIANTTQTLDGIHGTETFLSQMELSKSINDTDQQNNFSMKSYAKQHEDNSRDNVNKMFEKYINFQKKQLRVSPLERIDKRNTRNGLLFDSRFTSSSLKKSGLEFNSSSAEKLTEQPKENRYQEKISNHSVREHSSNSSDISDFAHVDRTQLLSSNANLSATLIKRHFYKESDHKSTELTNNNQNLMENEAHFRMKNTTETVSIANMAMDNAQTVSSTDIITENPQASSNTNIITENLRTMENEDIVSEKPQALSSNVVFSTENPQTEERKDIAIENQQAKENKDSVTLDSQADSNKDIITENTSSEQNILILTENPQSMENKDIVTENPLSVSDIDVITENLQVSDPRDISENPISKDNKAINAENPNAISTTINITENPLYSKLNSAMTVENHNKNKTSNLMLPFLSRFAVKLNLPPTSHNTNISSNAADEFNVSLLMGSGFDIKSIVKNFTAIQKATDQNIAVLVGHNQRGYPREINGLFWEPKEYMLTVLIPISCGVIGALMFVGLAYVLRNCSFKKQYHLQAEDPPEVIPNLDQILLLEDSSDEDESEA